MPSDSTRPSERLLVAIAHYGDLEPTVATIASVRATHPSARIWVVDNQGTGIESVPPSTATRIERWLEPERNLGYGGAIDLVASVALGEGNGEALLALNNDVELAPGAISELLAELESDSSLAAVTPRILLDVPAAPVWYDGGSIDWFRGTARVPAAGRQQAELGTDEPRDVGFVTGCVLLLRLAALVEAGGFDRRYFLYEEDVELSLRLRRAGWRLRHLPRATARHRGQASQRSAGEAFLPIHHPRHPALQRLIELRVSNRLLTAQRHARGTDRLRFLLGFPLYWSFKCLQATINGRPRAWLAAIAGIRRYRRLRHTAPDDAVPRRPPIALD